MKFGLISVVGLALIPVSVACARDHWVYVPPPPVVIVADEPPAPVVEVPVACPGPGYVWVGGAWEAHRGRWVWTRGRWELPPRGRHDWERGHWEYRGEHRDRVWINAHWR